MRALDRKLLRDLWLMRGQAMAIAMVIACGVGVIVMMLSTQKSLQWTRQTFYDRYRFADIFLSLKRAPDALSQRIAEIPGVREVQTRVVTAAFVDIEGMHEPAVGRLFGIPAHGQPKLNRLHLRSGRYLDPTQSHEVLVSETFAQAHKLTPGNSLRIIVNGRRQRVHIVGIALSPESIYEIQEGQLIPDPKRFGVLWMDNRELSTAFDLEGAFNSVTVALERQSSQAEVIQQLDELTEKYGGSGAIARRDQPSHRFLENEMQQLRSMGTVVPLIFLSVAAFLLNIVLGRLINTQREQIAVLKAFGYSWFEIAGHYMVMTLLVAMVGAVIGTGVGIVMGRGMTALYTEFFHFPVFSFHLDRLVLYAAWLVACLAAITGAAGAVWKAMRLPPAEAMRPEPPARYRISIIERLGLSRVIPPAWKMVLRQVERTPRRTIMSVLGVSMGVAVMILGNFMADSITQLVHLMFSETQRYDISLGFSEPAPRDIEHELRKLPGVMLCELFRGVPVRLTCGSRSRLVGIQGLPENAEMYQFVDAEHHVSAVPTAGLLLSAELATILGASVGDNISVDVLSGDRPHLQMQLTGTVHDIAGLMAYAELDWLGVEIQDQTTASGAYLRVDAAHQVELLKILKERPRVASVNIKQASIDSFHDTVAKNLLTLRMFNMMFATVIAIGVVYNTARIALAERMRELATLRVLGFTRREISSILLGELGVITTLGLPVGCGLGYLFAILALSNIDREMFRIPLSVQPITYVMAMGVVIVASIGASLLVRRQLDHLDLVSVLKTRE